MLKIRFVVVDQTRSSFLREGEDLYFNRLRRYAQPEWVAVKPAKIKKGKVEREVLAEEENVLKKRLSRRDYTFALDRCGKVYDSEQLAARIDRLSLGHDRLAFVIGGPLGLSRGFLAEADEALSLSRLTLTHEMCRLVLLEQIYRAFTIISGEQYHK